MDSFSSASRRFHGHRRLLRPASASRRCGFEQLEPRQLLAADLAAEIPDLSSGATGGRTGEISGNVYASQQAGCGDHASDSALANVRVQLLDDNGNVLEQTVTGQDGSYTFADLLPGQYAIRQITAQGFLDGASAVGTGGGIVFGTDIVGEILVEPGQALEGYDFCDIESLPEPSGPADRPIVPHQLDSVVVLPFQFPTTSTSRPAEDQFLYQPASDSVVTVTNAQPTSLDAPRSAVIFGGSSRTLSASEEIKTWDEYLFDDMFAHTSFLDFEESAPGSAEELDALLEEIDEVGDAPLVDGYTVNSVEWWGGENSLDLYELLSDDDLIQPDDEQPETQQPVAEIARREKTHQAQ